VKTVVDKIQSKKMLIFMRFCECERSAVHCKSETRSRLTAVFALCTILSLGFGEMKGERVSTRYDADPDHVWNRLHAAIWMRTAPDGTFHGEELVLTSFLRHEIDRFEVELPEWKQFITAERKPRLTCFSCHSGWGIHGVNTRSEVFLSSGITPPTLSPTSLEVVAARAVEAKKQRYEWGLLDGLWRALR